jgi:hypothetical protein
MGKTAGIEPSWPIIVSDVSHETSGAPQEWSTRRPRSNSSPGPVDSDDRLNRQKMAVKQGVCHVAKAHHAAGRYSQPAR